MNYLSNYYELENVHIPYTKKEMVINPIEYNKYYTGWSDNIDDMGSFNLLSYPKCDPQRPEFSTKAATIGRPRQDMLESASNNDSYLNILRSNSFGRFKIQNYTIGDNLEQIMKYNHNMECSIHSTC